MTIKRIVVLGATGSVGRQALDVIDAHPDRFELIGLGAGSDKDALRQLASGRPGVDMGLGEEENIALARHPAADVVLNAIVGAAGLRASVAVLEEGTTLALANKESLVAGGDVCLAAAKKSGAKIAPVDSEHAALAQCLEGRDRSEIERVFLTASGGPFRQRSDLEGVTPEDALAHPTWSMGPKITVDSATLMNKGFEIIEARFLFAIDYEAIEVAVHPQSAVHAMVGFVDGSFIMQAAPTDMRIPIQAALSAPERIRFEGPRADPRSFGDLLFEPLDHARFPAVELACQAGRNGSTYPAALNAANEVAVRAFLDGELAFTDIVRVCGEVLEAHSGGNADSLEGVLEVDGWAREEAERVMSGRFAGAKGSE